MEVRSVLTGRDRHICADMIFVRVTQLLQLIDGLNYERKKYKEEQQCFASQEGCSRADGVGQIAPPEGPVRGSATHGRYQRLLLDAKHAFELAAQRVARLWYCFGMLFGVAVLVGALVVAGGYFDLERLQLTDGQATALTLGVILGAIGAIVSVMQRMTQNNLVLQHRAGRLDLFLIGIFKPLLGSVFAMILFMLLTIGLLPMSPPRPDVAVEKLLFAGVAAFFAGFSERVVQDVLEKGEGALGARGAGEGAGAPAIVQPGDAKSQT
jgi:hypothetical protein